MKPWLFIIRLYLLISDKLINNKYDKYRFLVNDILMFAS